MQSIQVKAETSLSYIDSGIPNTGDDAYNTIVVIHGVTWSGETFRPAIEEARSKGLRIISLNRRGFPGSTPFSDDEIRPIEGLTSNYESARAPILHFMADRASEIASFIHHLVVKERIPAPDGHGKGGIALMGWSFGNAFGINFVYNAQHLQEPYRATVMRYVTSYILFDPPSDILNMPSPGKAFDGGASQRMYQRVVKKAAPDDPNFASLMAIEFNDWVSSWFKFDLPQSPYSAADLEAALEKGDFNLIKPSIWSSGDKQFTDCYIASSFPHEIAIWGAGVHTSAFAQIAEAVCHGDAWRSPEWSGFRLSWMCAEHAPWGVVYPAFVDKEKFTHKIDGKEGLRRMISIPGANHFVQWNDPERFVSSVTSIL